MQLIQKQICGVIVLILFMLVLAVQGVSAAEPAGDSAAEIQKPARYLVVTYFHTSLRCPTCHKIEELSADAVNLNFEEELKTGKVVWRVVNVEEPENQHFTTEYQLYSKHLVVSEIKEGKEARWKDLKDIWILVRNDEKFENYVKTEIAEWLKE